MGIENNLMPDYQDDELTPAEMMETYAHWASLYEFNEAYQRVEKLADTDQYTNKEVCRCPNCLREAVGEINRHIDFQDKEGRNPLRYELEDSQGKLRIVTPMEQLMRQDDEATDIIDFATGQSHDNPWEDEE